MSSKEDEKGASKFEGKSVDEDEKIDFHHEEKGMYM
jgi:hypothetical protein